MARTKELSAISRCCAVRESPPPCCVNPSVFVSESCPLFCLRFSEDDSPLEDCDFSI